MKKEKILAALMAAAMIAANGAVFAEELISEETAIKEAEEVIETAAAYTKVVLEGTAAGANGNQLYITEGETEMAINTSEDTLFITADGNKITFGDIKSGDSLRIIAEEAMTMSLPPQSYGHIVIKYEEGQTVPVYAEIESVKTDENGNTVATSKDGMYEIVIGGETELAPLATRQIVGLDAIKKDAKILAYSNLMTMSIPAVMPAEKVIVLAEELASEEKTEPEKVLVNGEEIDAQIINNDSVYMLPVRKICEALGLEVKWDGELKAISVGTIPMGVTFNIGENSYTKARMMPMTLTSAPILDEDRTFVPLDFYSEILGADVTNENGVIAVNLTVTLD
ncbi:MAG: copper amine oxidase N-terminal domain-containing protein [Clostridia bacterium]|nr:copper amine oxidase N-terminal domain-containing protein [Clostridia bacterium]